MHLPFKATIPIGLAPGGVYPAIPVTRDAVRSYRTLSSLPPAQKRKEGGLLSVALSLRSPSLAINQHRISVEPGLSSPAWQANPLCGGDHPAICRPLSTIYGSIGQVCCAIVTFQAKSGAHINPQNILSIIDEKTDRPARPSCFIRLQYFW